MKILDGHLTALNKKVVKQMIANNLTEGSYKGTDYYLTSEKNTFLLKQIKLEWDCDWMRNKKVKKVYKSKFTI